MRPKKRKKKYADEQDKENSEDYERENLDVFGS